MHISVVIVSWNGRSMLEDCLQSLKVQTYDDFETIVVDNGSSDGTPEMVRQKYPEVVLLETGENLGFAEGCNRGIAVAKGCWIGTLNQDAVVRPEWLAALSAIATKDLDRVGMLQSKILFKNAPALINSTGVVLLPDGGGLDREFMAAERSGDALEEVFCPSAGAALYKREMLDEVSLETGCFDRTFFMYWEDLDLGWRCRLANWKALYVPSAVVLHLFQASSVEHGPRFGEFQCRKNRLRCLLKNGSLSFVVRCIPQFFHDFSQDLRGNGFKAISNLFSAIRDGLRQRGRVSALRKISRKTIETRWVSRPVPSEEALVSPDSRR